MSAVSSGPVPAGKPLEPPVLLRVEFHTSVPQPVEHVARVLRKAYRQGTRVVCVSDGANLQAISHLLWTLGEPDFLAHVRFDGSPPALAARTTVWLTRRWSEPCAGRVLVNLGCELLDDSAQGEAVSGGEQPGHAPLGWRHAARLIEVVGEGGALAQAARLRWRGYQRLGMNVVHHLSSTPS